MTKMMKRILLGFCSLVFVVCFGIVGILGLNTDKKLNAKAATQANFTGILGQYAANYGSGAHGILYLQFDTVLSEAGISTTVGDDLGGKMTFNGGDSTAHVAYMVKQYVPAGNVLELILLNASTFDIYEVGDTINIEEGTSLGDVTLPEVTVVFNGTEWEVPTTEEDSAVTFTGVNEVQNNDVWESAAGFMATYLVFDKDFVTADTNFVNSGTGNDALSAGIYYVDENGAEQKFDFIWVNSATNTQKTFSTIMLLESGTTAIADGSVLHIKAGTILGNQVLPELTLYMVNGNWQTEEPAPAAKYLGIVADVQNEGNGRAVLALEFDKPMNAASGIKANLDPATVSTNTFNITLNGNAVEIKNAGGCILPRNRAYATTTSDNVLELYFMEYSSNREFADGVTSPFASGTVLKIGEGTVVNGYDLPELTFYFNGETWQTEKPETETPDPAEPTLLTFKEITWNRIGFNEYAEKNVILLQYSDEKYSISDAAVSLMTELGDAITIGGVKISEMTDGAIMSHPNYGACFLLIQYDATYATHGAAFEIAQTTVGDVIIPEITLYMNGTTYLWQDTAPETETPDPTEPTLLTFKEITWNRIGFNEYAEKNVILLQYSDERYSISDAAVSLMTELGDAITIGGVKISEMTDGAIMSRPDYGACFLLIQYDSECATHGAAFEITQTTVGDVIIPEITLYMNSETWLWQTEEPEVVEPTEVTFVGITEWNNHSVFYANNGRLYTVLQFSEALYADKESGQALLEAVKDSVKLNGATFDVAMTAGSDGNFGIQILKTDIPALSADCPQVILTIEGGTVVGNYKLPAVTLYLNKANVWQTEEYTYVEPTEVTFVGIPEWNNHPVFYANNGRLYTVLQFSEALYADKESGQALLAAVKDSVKLNGATFDVAMTAGSDGNFGIQILKTDIPALSADCPQVILTIEGGTVVGNYKLPAVTLYLNKANLWQTKEYTYVEPTEVTFKEIDEWNNTTPPWTKEYYLTNLYFSMPLYLEDGDVLLDLIRENIKVNGVNGVDLGIRMASNDATGKLGIQIPVAHFSELWGDCSRVILSIDEGTVVGDCILPNVRFYLTAANKWKLIDETDKTAPIISYNGTTEIETTEGKPFVIEISAFDNEDDSVCEIYYAWSVGALDENGNLIKGNHTCTVTAMDKPGNEAKLILTVNVGDKDELAPVITAPTSLTTVVGATPEFTYKAVDNSDGEILCEISWSEGALDEEGKLLAGTHTMTLTATDLTGNTSTKTVTVVVEEVAVDDLLGDSEAANDGEKPSKKGCSGNISGVSVITFLALTTGVSLAISLKRRKDNE